MTAQLFALLTALSYASANVAIRLGLKYSTPTTATLTSLVTHTVVLWSAVFITSGIPPVVLFAVLTIAITGMMQPVVRFCHYTGMGKIGASRATTLRNTHPLISVVIGITLLHEAASLSMITGTFLIVAGIVLTSRNSRAEERPFRKRDLVYPLASAFLTGLAHPIRRYAMTLSDEPLFLAAVVGPVSLVCYLPYLRLSAAYEPLVWHRRAYLPFIAGGLFESMAGLSMLTAFAAGPVVLVSPIAATSPIWTLLIAAVLLRDIERINMYTILGTVCVVVGVIAVSFAQ